MEVCVIRVLLFRADSGSAGHGSNGSTNVNGSWVSTVKVITLDP